MSQRDIYRLPVAEKVETPAWVKTGYSLGIGLILLGIVVAGIAGGSVLSAVTRGSHSIRFPGAANLKLKSGLYIGLPAPNSSGENNGLSVTVTDAATGESVPVQIGQDMTVQVSGSQGGGPLFQFETPDAGTFLVSGTAATATGSLPVMLLHESLGRTRSDLAVGVFAGTLLLAGGVSLLWYVRRKQKHPTPPHH